MSKATIAQAERTKLVRERIVAHLKARLDAQGIKGPKRRAEAALHFLVGAAAALDAADLPAEYGSISALAFLVSIRGEGELK